MKPFKHIEQTKKVIQDLTFDLQYSKNKTKDAKRINTLIDCVNSFETMLEEQYFTDAIEVLLLSMLENYFLECYAAEKMPPMKVITNRIDFNLGCSKELKKKQVCEMLENIYISQALKQPKTRNQIKNDLILLHSDKKTTFDNVTRLINEFKTNIFWELKK